MKTIELQFYKNGNLIFTIDMTGWFSLSDFHIRLKDMYFDEAYQDAYDDLEHQLQEKKRELDFKRRHIGYALKTIIPTDYKEHADFIKDYQQDISQIERTIERINEELGRLFLVRDIIRNALLDKLAYIVKTL